MRRLLVSMRSSRLARMLFTEARFWAMAAGSQDTVCSCVGTEAMTTDRAGTKIRNTNTPVALRADLRMARGIMMQLQSNCFEEAPITPVQIYINSNQGVNARSCPRTSCEAVDVLSPGTAVTSIGIQDGDTVSGSSEWHRIRIDGEDAFVHSSLVSSNRPPTPAPQPTNAPAPMQSQQNQQSQPVSTAVPLAPPPVSSGGGCPNLGATCGQLTCDQAYACLGAGNGRLDRDNDGVPCESICPGG
jgi:SH3-like domain-containing protein